jgi:hypothetical protein
MFCEPDMLPPAVEPVADPPAVEPVAEPPAVEPVAEPPAVEPVAEPPAVAPLGELMLELLLLESVPVISTRLPTRLLSSDVLPVRR